MSEVQEGHAWLLELPAMLAAPEHQDNPLLPLLEQLYGDHQRQQRRLDRLLNIADGYNNMEHLQYRDLLARYERQLRRLEKIARISDLNQRTIMELNITLRQAALLDSLTGLPNRRHGTERLEALVAQSQRSGEAFALILLDIDNFKRINDKYGHAVGDRVLCLVADSLRCCLRPYDLCARWGGEEFLVMLPKTDAVGAAEVAERILARLRVIVLDGLEPLRKESDPPALRVTASAGVTVHGLGEPGELTIQRADDAMYRSKAEGRDRVTVAVLH